MNFKFSRKYLSLLLFLFLSFVNIGFSINILDSYGNERNYFSSEIPDIYFETLNTSNNLTIKYYLSGILYNKTYNLTSCLYNSSLNCFNLNIYDLIESSNSSIYASLRYDVFFENESNYFYLDLIPPNFDFLETKIDKENNSFNFNFSYNDNFKILNADLYYINDSGKVFLGSLLNKSNFSFNIPNRSFNLEVDLLDSGGNTITYSKYYDVGDIFNPVLNNLSLYEDLNGGVYFNFSVYDDSLIQEIKLIFKDFEINYFPNSSSIVYGFNLPVKEDFSFYVIDNFSNELVKNITIFKSFEFQRNKEFLKDKEFKITLDADYCKLKSLNSNKLDRDFSKNGNEFILNLNDINLDQGRVNLNFICGIGNFSKEFESSFIYDITPPENFSFLIEKDSKGGIILRWDETRDNFSDVRYNIYKDGKKISSTKNLVYKDYDVEYPNKYEYFIEAEDLAGNRIQTEVKKAIPKKVIFNIKTNINSNSLNLNSSKFSLKFDLDQNSTLYIKLKNSSNKIIFEKIINNSKNEEEIILDLNEGENYLEILAKDVAGNEKSFNYILNYVNLNTKKNTREEVIKKEVINLSNSSNEVDMIKENSFNNSLNFNDLNQKNDLNIAYLLILILLLLILLLSLYLGYLSKDNRDKSFLFRKKKGKKEIEFNQFFGERDKNLEKEVLVSKKKLKERKKKLSEGIKKEEKKISDYKKIQSKDLKVSKKINLEEILKKRKGNMKENKKLSKKTINFENPLLLVKKAIQRRKREKELEQKKRNDPFNKYLEERQSKRRSWNSTKEYLLKTKLEREEKRRKKEEEKRRELEERQKEKEKKEKEKQLEIEKKEKELELKRKLKEERKMAKESLDDYLKEKSKKRKLFFAEKEVNSLFKRKKK